MRAVMIVFGCILAAGGCDGPPSSAIPRDDVARTLETTIRRACAAGCPAGFTMKEPGPEPATCTADCGAGGKITCEGAECGAVDGAGCHSADSTGATKELKLCLTHAPPPPST